MIIVRREIVRRRESINREERDMRRRERKWRDIVKKERGERRSIFSFFEKKNIKIIYK